MKKIFIAFSFFAILSGCDNKQDANEENFSSAINQYLDKNGELCLTFDQWPLDVTEKDLTLLKSSPTWKAAQAAALQSVGIVSSSDVEVDVPSLFDKSTIKKVKVKRYEVTDFGMKFFKSKDVPLIMGGTKKIGMLCYGGKRVSSIVKWEGPRDLGGSHIAKISYLFKVDNLADWAKSKVIKTSFPAVASVINGEKKDEEHAVVKLTNLGWEHSQLK